MKTNQRTREITIPKVREDIVISKKMKDFLATLNSGGSRILPVY